MIVVVVIILLMVKICECHLSNMLGIEKMRVIGQCQTSYLASQNWEEPEVSIFPSDFYGSIFICLSCLKLVLNDYLNRHM
jgi:hypothetical protein